MWCFSCDKVKGMQLSKHQKYLENICQKLWNIRVLDLWHREPFSNINCVIQSSNLEQFAYQWHCITNCSILFVCFFFCRPVIPLESNPPCAYSPSEGKHGVWESIRSRRSTETENIDALSGWNLMIGFLLSQSCTPVRYFCHKKTKFYHNSLLPFKSEQGKSHSYEAERILSTLQGMCWGCF